MRLRHSLTFEGEVSHDVAEAVLLGVRRLPTTRHAEVALQSEPQRRLTVYVEHSERVRHPLHAVASLSQLLNVEEARIGVGEPTIQSLTAWRSALPHTAATLSSGYQLLDEVAVTESAPTFDHLVRALDSSAGASAAECAERFAAHVVAEGVASAIDGCCVCAEKFVGGARAFQYTEQVAELLDHAVCRHPDFFDVAPGHVPGAPPIMLCCQPCGNSLRAGSVPANAISRWWLGMVTPEWAQTMGALTFGATVFVSPISCFLSISRKSSDMLWMRGHCYMREKSVLDCVAALYDALTAFWQQRGNGGGALRVPRVVHIAFVSSEVVAVSGSLEIDVRNTLLAVLLCADAEHIYSENERAALAPGGAARAQVDAILAGVLSPEEQEECIEEPPVLYLPVESQWATVNRLNVYRAFPEAFPLGASTPTASHIRTHNEWARRLLCYLDGRVARNHRLLFVLADICMRTQVISSAAAVLRGNADAVAALEDVVSLRDATAAVLERDLARLAGGDAVPRVSKRAEERVSLALRLIVRAGSRCRNGVFSKGKHREGGVARRNQLGMTTFFITIGPLRVHEETLFPSRDADLALQALLQERWRTGIERDVLPLFGDVVAHQMGMEFRPNDGAPHFHLSVHVRHHDGSLARALLQQGERGDALRDWLLQFVGLHCCEMSHEGDVDAHSLRHRCMDSCVRKGCVHPCELVEQESFWEIDTDDAGHSTLVMHLRRDNEYTRHHSDRLYAAFGGRIQNSVHHVFNPGSSLLSSAYVAGYDIKSGDLVGEGDLGPTERIVKLSVLLGISQRLCVERLELAASTGADVDSPVQQSSRARKVIARSLNAFERRISKCQGQAAQIVMGTPDYSTSESTLLRVYVDRLLELVKRYGVRHRDTMPQHVLHSLRAHDTQVVNYLHRSELLEELSFFTLSLHFVREHMLDEVELRRYVVVWNQATGGTIRVPCATRMLGPHGISEYYLVYRERSEGTTLVSMKGRGLYDRAPLPLVASLRCEHLLFLTVPFRMLRDLRQGKRHWEDAWAQRVLQVPQYRELMHPLMRRRFDNFATYCSFAVQVSSTAERSAASPAQLRQEYLSRRQAEPDDDELEESDDEDDEGNPRGTAGNQDSAHLRHLLTRCSVGDDVVQAADGFAPKHLMLHSDIVLDVEEEDMGSSGEEEEQSSGERNGGPGDDSSSSSRGGQQAPPRALSEFHIGQLATVSMLQCSLQGGTEWPPAAPLLFDVYGRAGVGKSECLHYVHSIHGKHSFVALCQTNVLALKLDGYTLDSFVAPRQQRTQINSNLRRHCKLSELGVEVMKEAHGVWLEEVYTWALEMIGWLHIALALFKGYAWSEIANDECGVPPFGGVPAVLSGDVRQLESFGGGKTPAKGVNLDSSQRSTLSVAERCGAYALRYKRVSVQLVHNFRMGAELSASTDLLRSHRETAQMVRQLNTRCLAELQYIIPFDFVDAGMFAVLSNSARIEMGSFLSGVAARHAVVFEWQCPSTVPTLDGGREDALLPWNDTSSIDYLDNVQWVCVGGPVLLLLSKKERRKAKLPAHCISGARKRVRGLRFSSVRQAERVRRLLRELRGRVGVIRLESPPAGLLVDSEPARLLTVDLASLRGVPEPPRCIPLVWRTDKEDGSGMRRRGIPATSASVVTVAKLQGQTARCVALMTSLEHGAMRRSHLYTALSRVHDTSRLLLAFRLNFGTVQRKRYPVYVQDEVKRNARQLLDGWAALWEMLVQSRHWSAEMAEWLRQQRQDATELLECAEREALAQEHARALRLAAAGLNAQRGGAGGGGGGGRRAQCHPLQSTLCGLVRPPGTNTCKVNAALQVLFQIAMPGVVLVASPLADRPLLAEWAQRLLCGARDARVRVMRPASDPLFALAHSEVYELEDMGMFLMGQLFDNVRQYSLQTNRCGSLRALSPAENNICFALSMTRTCLACGHELSSVHACNVLVLSRPTEQARFTLGQCLERSMNEGVADDVAHCAACGRRAAKLFRRSGRISATQPAFGAEQRLIVQVVAGPGELALDSQQVDFEAFGAPWELSLCSVFRAAHYVVFARAPVALFYEVNDDVLLPRPYVASDIVARAHTLVFRPVPLRHINHAAMLNHYDSIMAFSGHLQNLPMPLFLAMHQLASGPLCCSLWSLGSAVLGRVELPIAGNFLQGALLKLSTWHELANVDLTLAQGTQMFRNVESRWNNVTSVQMQNKLSLSRVLHQVWPTVFGNRGPAQSLQEVLDEHQQRCEKCCEVMME